MEEKSSRVWTGLTTCRYTLSLFLFSTADELLAPSKNPVSSKQRQWLPLRPLIRSKPSRASVLGHR